MLGRHLRVIRERCIDELDTRLVSDPAGAWELLLLQIRSHLELQTPLDAEIRVQVNGGPIEWWRVQGSVERNPGGQPVRLAGSVRDISAERPRLATDSEPPA